ncbi:MAG: tetratricopeptide repeat protein [Methanobacteriota archaeon]
MAPGTAEQLLKKARSAFEKHAHDEALSFCKEAIVIVDKEMTGPTAARMRADILLLMADAKDISGAWIDAILYLDGVSQISMSLGDNKLAVESLIRAGYIMTKKSKWADALKKFEKAETISSKHGNHRLLGRALAGEGIVLWRQAKYLEAIRHGERAAEMGKKTKDDELIGRAMSLISNVRFDRGEYEPSLAANAESLASFEKVKDDVEIARLLNNSGETYKVMGEYKRALEFFDKCVKVAERSGNKRTLGYAMTNMAESSIRLGDVTKARKHAAKAEEAFKGMEDRYALANLTMVWGLILEAEGTHAEADEKFAKAGALMTELEIPYDTGVIRLEHGRALARRGDAAGAKLSLKAAVRSFTEAGATGMREKAEKELASLG